MDAYRLGNRQTFNAAFMKLGLDCVSWTEPVYLDLLRKSAGDEHRMVNFYFNRIGWPSSLPTRKKESLVKNVLQKKKIAMDEFLMSESLTLRPGVKEFIDDAYKEGIPVVVPTTYSKSGDRIASLEKIIAALRAGAEVAGLPACDCVLVAGSQSGVAGAERVGCIVVEEEGDPHGQQGGLEI